MDLLEHFAAVRAPHGREQCACCEGDGAHGSRACQRCAGTGFVRQGSDEPWCAPRESDQPAPRRRHWREPRTAARPGVPFTVAPEHPLPRDFLEAYDDGREDQLPQSVRHIPIAKIKWAHQSMLDPGILHDYQHGDRQGDFLPEALQVGEHYHLNEGHHRAQADFNNGKKTIKSVVFHEPPGGWDYEHQPRTAARRDPWHGEGPWYHGTPEDLEPGTVIQPGDVIGKQHMGRGSDSTRTWVTNDAWKASSYGTNIYEVDPSVRPKSMYARHHEHYLPEGGTATVLRQVPYQEATELSPEYQRGKKAMEKQIREQRRQQHEAGVEDYGIGHRPLSDGAPAHDLTQGYSEDIYTHPQYWAAHNPPERDDLEGFAQLLRARGKPEAKVHIYRASHKDAPHEINPGDWVTLSKTYAGKHAYAESGTDDPEAQYTVHHAVVPAQHVRDAGTDYYREQGYWGPPIACCGHGKTAVLAEHPEYGPEPKYDHEAYERDPGYFDAYRDRKRAWGTQVKRGLSLGHLSAGEAKGLGYYFGGHETDRNGEPGWQALPREMYHATTDLPAVRQHGLKTRDELEQGRGHGLGGGESDTISVTTDHQLGRHILGALHEYHRVVNGKYTPQQMWEHAKAGTGASRPFHEDLAMFWEHGWKDGDEMPRGLHNALHAVHRESTLGTDQEHMDREKGPGWRPAHDDEGWMSGHKPPRKIHAWWERDMTPDETRENAADFYSKFSGMREHAGGPEDPMFFGTDTKAFAAKDPKHFALLHVSPKPGGQGYPMGGMREWRTGTGDALDVHHYEQQHGGQLHTAAFRRLAGNPDEYQMEMQPDEHGDPLHDMGSRDWPGDFYDRIHEYDFSHGEHGSAHLTQIRRARGNPEKRVRIYRAAPAMNPESRNAKKGEINHGDWVTLNKPYAEEDARGVNERSAEKWKGPNDPGRSHIWSTVVPAKHVRSAGNDLMEWGYWGEDRKDLEHNSERCSHRNPFIKRERSAPRRRFEDTDYAGKHHYGGPVPAAERTESVRHMLSHYAPTDFGTWDEVRDNITWDHPQVRAFVEDVRQNGVRRPIPVDYESDPPRVMNGHMRLLSAERAGLETVPARQHEGFMDPDDPDHLGRGPDDPEHWTNRWEREGSRFPYSHLKVPPGAVHEPKTAGGRITWFAAGPALSFMATDLFHGSDRDEPFSRFDFHRRSLKSEDEEESPLYKQEGEGMTTRWWNSRLGSHFTSEHHVASEIAQRMGGGGNVYHVDLRQQNPKHYASEHDLAEEGVTWARKQGYQGLRNLGFSWDQGGWHHAEALQKHPKAQEIAEGFRAHLQSQGYDGITYGNEYEGTKGHLSAIAFHPDQAKITETHGGHDPCRYDDMRHEAGQRGDLPELEYHHVLQGREKGGYHAVVAAHEGQVIGHLTWGPARTKIMQLWVHPQYRRHGVADALYQRSKWIEPGLQHHTDRTGAGDAWARSVSGDVPEHLDDTTSDDAERKGAWAARQFQERLDSGHRTMQRLAVLPLRNPHTGGRDWYHGTMASPGELKPHGFADPSSVSPLADMMPESETEGGHWNSLLGTHFTADHDVAKAFAEGEHSSGANERAGDWDDGEYGEPHRGIVHARLGLKNPKVYDSEHDMDHEAYEHEYAAGNHPSNHVPGIGKPGHGDDEDDEELYEAEEMWHHAHRIARDYGHGEIPASTYGHMRTPFQGHPMRTAWLNTHPDKYDIAMRFKKRLQAAGHDGVVYGNEYEKSKRGREANKSAIAFDPGQIHVTQHHRADERCDPEPAEHEAARDISKIRLKHEPPIVSGHWERDEQGVPTNWVDTDPAQGHHMLTALAPNNRTVGWMHWDKGVIRKIDVNDNWKRSGLGRRMWERASEITPGLSHSDNRTDEGQGFAKAVGGPLPERVQDHPEWFREAARRGPWYHGTNHELAEGQELTPEGAGDEHVYFSGSREHADFLASVRADPNWTPDQPENSAPRTYEVEPLGKYEPDPEDEQHYTDAQAYRTRDRVRVIRRAGVFVPTERIFGPTYGLDHRLFGAGEKLRPAVRDAIMARLGGVLEQVLGPDWHLLATAWLAGSQVSKWTSPDLEGNGDLDVLIGLSHSHARQASPELAQLTDEQIEHRLNAVLRERFSAPGWHPPFDPDGTWDLTGYAIHAADIRTINPYAAYDLSDDRWTVRPPDLPGWSAEQFPQGPALMQQARALIGQVRAILRLPEPFRKQEAERIWRYIHEGRAQAFSPGGLGWQGAGNVLEKALDQASGQLVGKLKAVIYGSADHAPVALGHGMTTADLGSARAS